MTGSRAGGAASSPSTDSQRSCLRRQGTPERRALHLGSRTSIPDSPDEFLGGGAFVGTVSTTCIARRTIGRLGAVSRPSRARFGARPYEVKGVLLKGGHGLFRWHDDEPRFEKMEGLDHSVRRAISTSSATWVYYGFATEGDRRPSGGRDRIRVGSDYIGSSSHPRTEGDSWTGARPLARRQREAVDPRRHGWFTEYRAGGGIRRGPLNRLEGKLRRLI
jgi:hypothetical protein